MSEATHPSAAVAIAFAIGLGLAIAGLGHISGGHFNPAVSLGVVAARKFPVKELVPYWVAQLVGGFAAVLVVAVVYSNVAVDKLDTAPGAGISEELRRHLDLPRRAARRGLIGGAVWLLFQPGRMHEARSIRLYRRGFGDRRRDVNG